MNAEPGPAELGVIVVTYRSGPHLEGCFRGLRELVDETSLVVVDAASPDDTAAQAQQLVPRSLVLRMPSNRGYAAAVNAGLASISRPFLLILNADTAVEPGGVRAGVRWLGEHPEFGMLGPQLVGPDGRRQASRYREPGLRVMAGMYLLRDQREPAPLRTVDDVEEAEGIVGAAMLIRSDALSRVGPMDEDFFLYCEEVDWCARIRRAGLRVGTLPRWRLTHLGGASTATLATHSDVISHRSRYLYFLKHGGEGRAEMFRLLLLLSLPWIGLAAMVNGLIGRISWNEAAKRIGSQLLAVLKPLPRVPAC